MSDKKVIVVLGSVIAANKFADVARRAHNACVIEVYSSSIRESTRLSSDLTREYESFVIQQLNRARGGSSVEFDLVVFFYGQGQESCSFPFTQGCRFLGLSGEALFRKLVVVRGDGAISMGSGGQWPGLRVINGDEKIALSDFYFESARNTGRHHEEATILLVGHSGHGKSKTINRLIGHNLLEVGRMNNKLGSITKDVQRVKMPVPQPSDSQQPHLRHLLLVP
ncbi:hypothetical protein R3P38DRAFT_2768795 [Favolaschia claudopus]|uniref:Uncharacterized protein n=1 Tax=Favolaschia claudopus TaxID=2862362 RepID=A0AAW0CPM9_9AGAR